MDTEAAKSASAPEAAMLPFDEKEFWKLYDKYSLSNFRDKQINAALSEQLKRNYANIRDMKRPEKSWEYICGWVALRTQGYVSHDGSSMWMTVILGDVMIQQHPWDRDVLVTHVPLNTNLVSGYVLRSKHGEAEGLWVPIYDPDMLRIAIDLRIAEIKKGMLAFFAEEMRHWPKFARKERDE